MFGDRALDARQVAHIIRHSPAYKGGKQKVILYSCNTGKDPDGIARQLADILGCIVKAPNTEVHPLKSGGFLVADVYEEDGLLKKEIGKMLTFKPKK